MNNLEKRVMETESSDKAKIGKLKRRSVSSSNNDSEKNRKRRNVCSKDKRNKSKRRSSSNSSSTSNISHPERNAYKAKKDREDIKHKTKKYEPSTELQRTVMIIDFIIVGTTTF